MNYDLWRRGHLNATKYNWWISVIFSVPKSVWVSHGRLSIFCLHFFPHGANKPFQLPRKCQLHHKFKYSIFACLPYLDFAFYSHHLPFYGNTVGKQLCTLKISPCVWQIWRKEMENEGKVNKKFPQNKPLLVHMFWIWVKSTSKHPDEMTVGLYCLFPPLLNRKWVEFEGRKNSIPDISCLVVRSCFPYITMSSM